MRFSSLTLDICAVGQDCMSLLRKGKLPYLHSPLPMIQAMLNKDREENDATLIVVPNWPSQSWWPNLMELSTNYVNLGKSADVLKPGDRMRKAKKHLPPSKLIAVRIWSRHRKKIGEFEEFWTKSGKQCEDLTTTKDLETVISNFIAQKISVQATTANSNARRTAVGMLFRIQGFQEERINR
ncbi:MAG: hypothetical protein EZS28_045586, partial [Streblomastix strix]